MGDGQIQKYQSISFEILFCLFFILAKYHPQAESGRPESLSIPIQSAAVPQYGITDSHSSTARQQHSSVSFNILFLFRFLFSLKILFFSSLFIAAVFGCFLLSFFVKVFYVFYLVNVLFLFVYFIDNQ